MSRTSKDRMWVKDYSNGATLFRQMRVKGGYAVSRGRIKKIIRHIVKHPNLFTEGFTDAALDSVNC